MASGTDESMRHGAAGDPAGAAPIASRVAGSRRDGGGATLMEGPCWPVLAARRCCCPSFLRALALCRRRFAKLPAASSAAREATREDDGGARGDASPLERVMVVQDPTSPRCC
eukprot:16053224-Heterocapsa_arctica.AAC.1